MKALKIGGSVITNKFEYKKPNLKEIKRISKELKGNERELILIHGAGSFGHPLVEEMDLRNGIKNEKQKESITKIQNSVKELNKLFTEELTKQGIAVTTIHPSSCCLTKNGSIDVFEKKPIREALKQNIMPILHGDIVLDKEKGTEILSGDKIITYLSKELDIKKIGMGARSAVLDNQGEPIKKLKNQNLDIFKETKSIDVTGGMKLKVKELLSTKKPSFIFDATKKGNIKRFLENEKIGTEVLYNDNKG